MSNAATPAVAQVQDERRDPTQRLIVSADDLAALPQGQTSSSLPAWARKACGQITARLTDPDFPCLFARQANQRGALWFVSVESFEPVQLTRLRDGLLEYLSMLRQWPADESPLMALLAVFRPPPDPMPLDWYHNRAWAALQYLHDHDASPWPAHTPTDPAHPLWSFCFDGEQLFVNVSAPAHRQRRSRNLGDALTLVIQPRRNFDLVAGDNEEGQRVRRMIRQRMADYDDQQPPAHLGTYGRADNREWTQYAISDSGDDAPGACPLAIRVDDPCTEDAP